MPNTLLRVFITLYIVFGLHLNSNAAVYISEFVASNKDGLQDETGDHPDWIEIHNNGAEAVNLLGWKLSDSSPNKKPWAFPEFNLEPDAYLVIFASGENRRTVQPFHTNFELKRSGESLRLIPKNSDTTVSIALLTPYPQQHTNTAYGHTTNGYRYLHPPTPGKPNHPSKAYQGILQTPKISHKSGWFSDPFTLSISNITPDTKAFYTLDGSEPTPENAIPFTSPLHISTTTTLRISIQKPDFLSPAPSTFTFLNESSVLSQSRPPNYPEFWAEKTPADYAMDPEITHHPDYQTLMIPALKALPIISLVTNPANLFNDQSGIYTNPEQDGSNWERPISLEFLNNNSQPSFQINAGLRIQGRSSRQPRTTPKHSFRLLFKHPYGPTTLQHPVFDNDSPNAEYNTLVLRATSNHSWLYPLAEQRQRAQYLRDPWVKETQRAMGHIVPKTKFTHLFLNGLYWGLYTVSERPDDAFMAHHFDGKKSDYDVIKGGDVVAGSNIIWQRLFTLADQGLQEPQRYQALTQYLNLNSFIDFIILNHFIGNETWDFGNWYAARRSHEGAKFQFFCWDAETTMNRVNENRVLTRNANRPTALFQALRKNEDFRKRFAQRLKLHCTGDGALTPQRNIERYKSLAQKIELPIIAESARWGDYRLTKHPYRTPPFERYTRNEHWYTEQHRILTEYFSIRTSILLNQYHSIKLYE